MANGSGRATLSRSTRKLKPSNGPSPRARIAIAAAASLFFGAYAFAGMKASGPHGSAHDFAYYWVAARALLHGENPYLAVQPGGIYNFKEGFLYPLPAAIIVIPFALIPDPIVAAACFIAVSTGLLVWGVTRNGYSRLPILGSFSFFWAASSGQFAPLIVAATLIPWLGFSVVAKPNLGVASIAHGFSRRGVIGAAGILLLSFIVRPSWASEWLAATSHRTAGNYTIPLLLPGGFVMLLALLRWRRPEARMLVVLACIPQSMLFYDQLLLWLVPATLIESASLGILSFIGWSIARHYVGDSTAEVSRAFAPAILYSIFIPCLLMILRRPNKGKLRETPASPESQS